MHQMSFELCPRVKALDDGYPSRNDSVCVCVFLLSAWMKLWKNYIYTCFSISICVDIRDGRLFICYLKYGHDRSCDCMGECVRAHHSLLFIISVGVVLYSRIDKSDKQTINILIKHSANVAVSWIHKIFKWNESRK